MSPTRRRWLLSSAVAALQGPAVGISKLNSDQVSQPGLYACYGSVATWQQLGLGKSPDTRPLYVGKAENTLASRDLAGHFGLRERGAQSPTGSSTLRRSLAALLAARRGYRGIPRNPAKPGYFSNYGLSEFHDADLSAWMEGRLRLAVWPHDVVAELDTIETDVLGRLLPATQPRQGRHSVARPSQGGAQAARRRGACLEADLTMRP